MKTLRQTNIKNCPGYFFNSMTNSMNLDTNLLGINQISFTSADITAYEIEYFKNLDGVNSLYLVFNDVDAYFECIDKNKYLVFALTHKNKKALENYRELWDEIKEEIKQIRGIDPFEYEKVIMKTEFESDNGLPLGKILNIPLRVMIARSVFEENGKYYPQIYLKDYFFECDYADDSYVCCKTRLKTVNCVDYGLFLSEKRA